MDDAALAEKTRILLEESAVGEAFSGALLVARGGQILFTAARGFAIEPAVLLNRTDTKFNLASVTKMMTAVAVLRLVSGGQLDLHAPVSTYAPDLPHAREITIHQLLTHTAGFGRYWNDHYRAARSDLRTIEAYVKLFADLPLEFPPGTSYQYGNCGYVLLGALIERVTGKSYYEYVRETLFRPLGMVDTDFLEMDLPVANCATGYTRENWNGPEDGRLRANTFIYAIKGSPSEHCFSTVDDLFRFCQALENYQLLDRDWTERALSPQAQEKPGFSYGYGFHIIDDGRHGRVVGHGGRALGGDTFALMYRDLGYTLIVLANRDRPAARTVVNAIADWLIL